MYYCPHEEDLKIAENMIDEMNILAMEADRNMTAAGVTRGKPLFSFETGEDFNDADVLGINVLTDLLCLVVS